MPAIRRGQETGRVGVQPCSASPRSGLADMKDQETQQKFIELRARGLSYFQIAKDLNVSKGTLINWSRKFRFEIQNQRAVELEALRERLIANGATRAQLLSEQLRKVEAELHTRNLTSMSTASLFTLAAKLRQEILRETEPGFFTSPTSQIPADEYHEEVQHWTP